MKLLSGRIWAKVDGVSSNGYHEKTNLPDESRRALTRGLAQKHQKSKTPIDFAVPTTDGNTTWVIAHVSNPRAVRPVTCSVRWYKSCIQKFFDLYFASILVSSIRMYIARTHPSLRMYRLMYVSEVIVARIRYIYILYFTHLLTSIVTFSRQTGTLRVFRYYASAEKITFPLTLVCPSPERTSTFIHL